MYAAAVPAQTSLENLGVRKALLEDLALKILYLRGELSLSQLAEEMRLNLTLVDALFQRLRKDQLCEVTGMTASVHRITTTSHGKTRALELLSLSQYAGPAPVSLKEYVERVRAQTIRKLDITPPEMEKTFQHLVLDPEVISRLGTAMASARAIFLYGPTGTGKTTIAETLARLLQKDSVWLPYAVEVDGQVITVFDPHLHKRSDEPVPPNSDTRWVLCRRPRVLVGGELTIEMLDLQFNPSTRYYDGPVQMKANNGLLIIDDFGRQRLRPDELLNRWVVPLDRHLDFLTLAGGRKLEMPFDLFVVFATNIDPAKLVDEAFLRRIQTKIKVDFVPPAQFHKIMEKVCREFNLLYSSGVVDELIGVIGEVGQPLRACFPRDIAQQICWLAKYEGRKPFLTSESMRAACRNYFLEPPSTNVD